MKLRVLMALACTLALIAVAAYSCFEADGYRNLVGFCMAVLWLSIAVGVVVNLIRAKRGGRIREAFSPVAGAADTYHSHLLGRPTMAVSTEEAARHTSTDKFTTGP